MEQDKQLKEILLESAEKPSAGFTNAVMQRINELAAASSSYQPLVAPRLQRLFVYIFCGLIVAIFGLCLLMALIHLQLFTWMQKIPLPDVDYRTILICILSFWLVFAINAIIEKKLFSRREPQL